MSASLHTHDSLVWQAPDLQLGSHAFCYTNSQYDGLLHTHREYSVVTCLSGSLLIHAAGADQLLCAGDTYVVNPGVPHRCTFGIGGQPTRGLTLLVVPQWLIAQAAEMGFLQQRSERHPSFHQTIQDPELMLSADKIMRECLTMSAGFHVAVELLVRQMLVHILRKWPRDRMSVDGTTVPPQLPWLYMHRSTEYMNAYGKGEFRLSELCQQVGLSPSRFIPLFRNSACMSPHDYYNHLLVFKARRLLRDERCSTKEAAYGLGFKNVSHFCSLYHKLTGTTPKADWDLDAERDASLAGK